MEGCFPRGLVPVGATIGSYLLDTNGFSYGRRIDRRSSLYYFFLAEAVSRRAK
jgi:hypothetical protein